jgi:hypothetical protein
MNRLRCAVLAGFLAGLLAGCGEEQPNTPAQPGEVNADFAKKTADMMKAANTGMDKKAKAGSSTPAKP